MMNIVCNTRCLNAALTGTQRYTSEILKAFPEPVRQIAPSPQFSRGMKGHVWEQLFLPAKVKNSLLWSPSNSGPLSVARQVVTIHDIVPVDHPEWFNKRFVQWYNYMLPRLCKKAEHIIAISEFTRQRVIEGFGIPESKVSLIYNGSTPLIALENESVELNLPFKRYVLSLGSVEPRKNIPLLLSAWNNILPKLPEDVGLVVVGGAGNARIFKDAGVNQMPDRVHFTGHVPDKYIAELYRQAIFFVYLSVYEGFGLPPLEAMAFGTPVLTGNRTALPEVVGDGGIQIDPYSQSACENAILQLIDDEDLRHDLSAKALLQVKKFDWKETSYKTWQALQRFS